MALELTAAGFHAPPRQGLSVASARRVRTQHRVLARKAEFLRFGAAGWLSLGQAVNRLREHPACAYHLIRRGRRVIQRDTRRFSRYSATCSPEARLPRAQGWFSRTVTRPEAFGGNSSTGGDYEG